MDQLLLPYLQATDESERQQYLDELLLVHAAPVVRQTLRRKLGFYVSQRGINPHNQDAEDLYQEIMTKVVQTLHDLRNPSEKAGLSNLAEKAALRSPSEKSELKNPSARAGIENLKAVRCTHCL